MTVSPPVPPTGQSIAEEPVVYQLNLREYWHAIREGLPIPLFAPLTRPKTSNRKDEPRPIERHRRHLKDGRLAHLLASPLSPDFYQQVHGVPEIIFRDLRRRAAEGRLPPRVPSTSPA